MYLLASADVAIERDCEDVFAYAANLENFADWFPGVIGIESANDLPYDSVGKQYLEAVAVPMRGTHSVRIRVTECRRPSRLITQGQLPGLLPCMEMEFSQSGSGCRINWRMFSRNQSLLARWSILPLAGLIMRRRAPSGLRRLKARLESAEA